jgi:hypothetical protein
LPVKTRLFVGDGLGIMPYLTTRAAINGSVIDHGTSSTIRWVLDDRPHVSHIHLEHGGDLFERV